MGFKSLGAFINEDDGNIHVSATKLHGNTISFDFPSVGATENIMIASCLAEGDTTIVNAAREPEIVDLANFLISMGAKISGAGSSVIKIKGVTELQSTEYTIMPDRIVAGTFLISCALCGGEIQLNNINLSDIEPITAKLEQTGCMFKKFDSDNKIIIKSPDKILPINKIETHPHPGLPTDIQPQLMSYLSMASGTSLLIETVFESRNKHVAELNKMGANITIAKDGRTFVINGVKSLHGAHVYARDLRGGAALIMAGLYANNKTVVYNSEYVERGYVNIEKQFQSLGGNIKFVS